MNNNKNVAEILNHRVLWTLSGEEGLDLEELDESSEEHIKAMIEDGYSSGELYAIREGDEEFYGWWNIEKREDAPAANGRREIEISGHRVFWSLDDEAGFEELDEMSEDHIRNMIRKGFNAGELCVLAEDDEEYYGWWSLR